MVKVFLSRIARFTDTLYDYYLARISAKSSSRPQKILISGLPRSGTTWFGSMLNGEGNLVFHEPFINHNLLWNWELDVRGGENFEVFKDIFDNTVYGDDWSRYQKRTNNKLAGFSLFHKCLNKRAYNVIVKDPGVVYLMDHFKTYDFDHFVLIYRNPLSIVGSLKKNDWDPTERLKRICEHPGIVIDDERIIRFLQDLESLSLIQKMALQTLIFQYIMEKSIDDSTILVKFEDFAANPIESFRSLYRKLNLTYNKRVEECHYIMTNSNSDSYSRHEVRRQSDQFIYAYERYLSESEISDVKQVYKDCKWVPMGDYFQL